MSRCRTLAHGLIVARPSLAIARPSSASVLLPFLCPSRSFKTQHSLLQFERRNGRDDGGGGDINFEFEQLSNRSAQAADPWAFLYAPSPPQQFIPPIGTPKPPVHRSSRYHDLPRHQLLKQPSGSITEREREIFNKIFEQILSESSSFSPRFKTSPTSFPSMSLDALFESAVGPQIAGPEFSVGPRRGIDPKLATDAMATASSIASYPPALRVAAARAAGLGRPNLSEEEKREENERHLELTGLVKQMQRCETDFELGMWMDENVFSLVTNASASSKGGDKKDSKANFPSANYTDLLLEGMRILRNSFNDLAGVVSIFERIKQLGVESYVVGCSAEVYNQIIDTKWAGFRDLHSIHELINEMEVNGIQGDRQTMEILRRIQLDVKRMDDGHEGDGASALFSDTDRALLKQLDVYLEELNEGISKAEASQAQDELAFDQDIARLFA